MRLAGRSKFPWSDWEGLKNQQMWRNTSWLEPQQSRSAQHISWTHELLNGLYRVSKGGAGKKIHLKSASYRELYSVKLIASCTLEQVKFS
jgi:hypothetical protein